jgi:hypothetical protein
LPSRCSFPFSRALSSRRTEALSSGSAGRPTSGL